MTWCQQAKGTSADAMCHKIRPHQVRCIDTVKLTVCINWKEIQNREPVMFSLISTHDIWNFCFCQRQWNSSLDGQISRVQESNYAKIIAYLLCIDTYRVHKGNQYHIQQENGEYPPFHSILAGYEHCIIVSRKFPANITHWILCSQTQFEHC